MIPVSQINTASDTWQDVIDRINRLSSLTTSNVVTSDASDGGSVTTGNVAVNGYVTTNVLSISVSIGGGTSDAPGVLRFSTNAYVGNSTVNLSLTSTSLTIGNVAVNSTSLAVGNSRVIGAGVIVGNSTVNAVVNSTSFRTGGAANVEISSTTISLANSAANVVTVPGQVTLANSTAQVIVNVGGVAVGSNVVVDSVGVRTGNSTSNSSVNSVALYVADGSQTVVVNSTGLAVGTTVYGNSSLGYGNSTQNTFVNSTGFFINGAPVGGDVSESQVRAALAALTAPAALVNSISVSYGAANSQALLADLAWANGSKLWTLSLESDRSLGFLAYAANGSLLGKMLEVTQAGALTVPANATINAVSIGSFGVTVGSNLVVNTTVFKVGNSTVNAVINSSSVYISGNPVAWRKASNSDVWSATADRTLTTELIESASALVTLTDGTNISVNWNSFAAGVVTMAGNRTLSNPTNVQPGTMRTIMVRGNNSSDRTLAFSSNYVGDLPNVVVNSSSFILLGLTSYNTTHIIVTSAKASS